MSFWTQKIKKKLGLLSPSPLQLDSDWRREGEEEEGEGEEGGRTWLEASQATVSRLARLRGAFVKGHRLPSGEASEGGVTPPQA